MKIRALVLVVSAVLSHFSYALTVNRLNGSASVIYIDFAIPGPVLPLELARTYNSITATSEQRGWQGAFGWGWTSPFETTMTVTPERNVLLRDGGNGNTISFRPEVEDPKVMTEFLDAVKAKYFESERGKKLTTEELSRLKLPERMAKQIKSDPEFRRETAAKFDIETKIPNGQVLISSEYGFQMMYQKNGNWVRSRDGMFQIFDNEGRLTKQIDKNGFYFTYAYSKAQKFQLEQISDANKSMSLRLKWKGDRVAEVTDNRGNKASYTYDALGNLAQVVDSNKQAFKYSYSNRKFPHLLTRIEYASENKGGVAHFREIQYDDNGLVVYHREKDGTEHRFSYGKIARDPENNFWTKLVTTEKGKKDETYDEYLIKARADGTKYLYRQENRQNGITTITVYTACCGKPQEITRNGATTAFKYYANGQLRERIGPKDDVRLEYDPKWRKVSKVTQNGVVSEYGYDDRGNLVRASNSRNEKVTLKYDKVGRILEMTDITGKAISFKYGDLGKPVLITQAGTGSIQISYDPQGRIKNAETIVEPKNRKPTQDSKEVVRRVMSGFQQLLDIIRPAGVGINLG